MEPETTASPESAQPSSAPSRRFGKKTIAAGIIVLAIIAGAIVHFFLTKSAANEDSVKESPNGRIITPAAQASATATPPVVVKGKDGNEYLTGEIIVAFKANVSVNEAKTIIAAQGGTIKQYFEQLPIFLISIAEPGVEGVDAAIRKYSRLDQVESAEPNYLTSIND